MNERMREIMRERMRERIRERMRDMVIMYSYTYIALRVYLAVCNLCLPLKDVLYAC